MLAFLLTPQFLQEEGGRERDLEVCPHSILFISPLFSGGVVGGCQESLLIQQQGERWCFGGWVSVPPMSTVWQCSATDSHCLRSDQFPREGATGGVERCSASQPLTLGTQTPQQETEELVPLLSHLATARGRECC